MTIEIYAFVRGKYHDSKRYICSVFCDEITFVETLGEQWFSARADGKFVLSGEVSCLHGKGNNMYEFVRDLR